MSGFEVIGVVLGVYPIVVSAWEAISQTKGDKGVQKLIRNLEIEETLYNEFVDHLIGPNTSEAQRCQLKTATSPGNLDAWHDAALQSKLKERLGFKKAKLIIGILGDLHIVLESMKTELPGPGRAFESRSSKFIKSFKQNLPQSPLKAQIETLREHNDSLQRLLSERGPPCSTGPSRQSTPNFEFPRRDSSHVVDVYNAICDGYRCNCNNAHYADLELPEITDPRRKKERVLSHNDQRRLQLLFPSEDPVIGNAVEEIISRNKPKDVDADEKTLVDREELKDQSQLQRSDTLPAIPTIDNTFRISRALSTARSFSIYECPDYQSDTIKDLCEYVRALWDENSTAQNSDPPCLLESKEKRFKLQASPREGTPASQKTVSLISKMADEESPLSRGDRMSLALRLSYAILQYYSTGWIDPSWSWNDFSVTNESKLEDSHLFVKQKFYSSSVTLPKPKTGNASLPGLWGPIGEPILTRLGYALIELALGRRLSDMRNEALDRSLPDDYQDYVTAIGIWKSGKIRRQEGKKYDEVVRVCLKHEFWSTSEGLMKTLDSGEPDFHEDVQKLVVAPLHCMWRENFGDSSRQP